MPRMSTKISPKKKPAKIARETKISRVQAPKDVATDDWQRALRRQFGREQSFGLENVGTDTFFSEFRVSNPQLKSIYRVAIRGRNPTDNFCAPKALTS